MTTTVRQTDKAVPAGFRLVEISTEPIELYKILKFSGMAASGGQAKEAVASGRVLVNGKLETQKRKKIVSGDTIEFNNEKICAKLSSGTSANPALGEIQGYPHKSGPAEAQRPEKE